MLTINLLKCPSSSASFALSQLVSKWMLLKLMLFVPVVVPVLVVVLVLVMVVVPMVVNVGAYITRRPNSKLRHDMLEMLVHFERTPAIGQRGQVCDSHQESTG